MSLVLVLRPEPGASETVRRAQEVGLDALALPLFTIAPVTWQTPDPARFDALLLTSANALRHGGAGLRDLRGLPVHAVGGATADAARNEGFDIASEGDAGVERLLGSIKPDLRLLHLCGADRRAPERPRQAITAIPVYRAEPVAAPDISAASGNVVMIHSPRAGARFAELIDQSGLPRGTVAIAAISETAAEAAGAGWRVAQSPSQPNDQALLALAARLCQKPPGE